MSSDDKTRLLPNMADTSVGTQLSGIYELDERIASGGMGEVYRGHNIQTGDHVAIKIVLPEFARDQTILSLFRKEASILNHLSHDAVVRYHIFTIDPGIGRPYLAMEFVDGQSLYDVMRGGAMATQDVRKLCHRLASGLSAVHQAGAIHRDLSPDNIILPGGRVDRAKIIDFGIARSATVGGETLIGGKFAGKYNYVSPEQLGLYGGEVSEQSDIYSLGLVLAAALLGKPIDMGGSQYQVVKMYTAAKGIDLGKDIVVVNANFAVARAQLEASRVDAALVIEPLASIIAKQNPDWHVIFNGAEGWKEIAGEAGWEIVPAMRADSIAKNPKAPQMLLAALQDTAQVFEKETAAADKIASDTLKLPPGILTAAVESKRLQMIVKPAWEAATKKSITDMMERAVKAGFYAKMPDGAIIYAP